MNYLSLYNHYLHYKGKRVSEYMDIVKVCIFAIVGVLIAIQIKSYKPEYGIYMGVAISLIIFSIVLVNLNNVIIRMEELTRYLDSGSNYLSILLKVVGITYVCEFCSSICRDAGYGSIAAQIEILGKVTVMFSGLPIIFAVIEQIQVFLA